MGHLPVNGNSLGCFFINLRLILVFVEVRQHEKGRIVAHCVGGMDLSLGHCRWLHDVYMVSDLSSDLLSDPTDRPCRCHE